MNLDYLNDQLREWHEYRYGERPRNGPKTLEKFFEEIGELMTAHTALQIENAMFIRGHKTEVDPLVKAHFAEEAADALFLLMHMVDGEGISLSDACQSKLNLIWNRAHQERAANKGGQE